MHADMLADDELHAREADAVVRQHRRVERQIGIAEIHHDVRCAAAPGRSIGTLRHLERQFAVIDTADLAFGAGDRDDRAGLQRCGGALGADHRRHAEFPRHDRGMAGAAAAVGDDRRRRSS